MSKHDMRLRLRILSKNIMNQKSSFLARAFHLLLENLLKNFQIRGEVSATNKHSSLWNKTYLTLLGRSAFFRVLPFWEEKMPAWQLWLHILSENIMNQKSSKLARAFDLLLENLLKNFRHKQNFLLLTKTL